MPYFNMVDISSGSFIWDENKDAKNQRVHGISLVKASEAFFDPDRIISLDEAHSEEEERYFCVGKVKGRVATVWFTYRSHKIRLIGAGYWRKGKKFYDQQTKKNKERSPHRESKKSN